MAPMWPMTSPDASHLLYLGIGFAGGVLLSLVLQRLGFSAVEKRIRGVSSEALQSSTRQFMDLADRFFSTYVNDARKDFDIKGDEIIRSVEPVKQALSAYEARLGFMERDREKAFGALTAQLMEMARTEQLLQKETGNLVKALRVPHVRGRWGEITLKRVAELAGMVDQCDFVEQPTLGTGKGAQRPDMVVRLPGNRQIIVDSKVPLSAYLDALDAGDRAGRTECLKNHARQLQAHVAGLSSKKYWESFQPTPEFVVLFVPGENYFSAALAVKPDLLETAIEKGVVIATPATLVALLKAVAYGWRQEKRMENAVEISQLGSELFQRLSSMADSMNRLGRDIERCAATYNKTVGTLERRVMTSARKLSSLGISQGMDGDLPEIGPAEAATRTVTRQDDE